MILGLLPLWAGAQTTDNGLSKFPDYKLAANALRDRLPEVAVVKLNRLLANPALKDQPRISVQLLLAEALIRAGQPAEARTLTESPELKPLPEALFWHAQALGQLGEWRAAEQDFETLARMPEFKYSVETVFCQAGMQAALGDAPRALRLLAPLITPSGGDQAIRARLWSVELLLSIGRAPEAAELLAGQNTTATPANWEAQLRYLRGRTALAQGDAAGAESLFALITEGAGRTPARLRQAAMLGRVRALRAAGRSLEALPALRQLLSLSPAPVPEVLAPAFRELESMNNPPAKEIQAFLATLTASPDPQMKARARFALAAAHEAAGELAENSAEATREIKEAESAWAAIPKELPDSPLLAEALLRQAQFYTTRQRRQEAVSVLKKLRALSPGPALLTWAGWVAGQAEYDARNYRRASQNFRETARQSLDPALRAAAAYNAAVAELQSGGGEPARELAILDTSPLAEFRMAGAEFHLERALYLASKGREEAMDGLKAFVDNLPDHARYFDALLALAELNLQADPPRLPEAERWLAQARAAAGTNAARLERTDLLEVYVAEAKSGPDALAAQAEKFLETWPLSAGRSDLRMKVAEMYFLRQQYSAAREQFEALAKDDPRSPLAEAAVFWAGKAALSALGPANFDQAVGLWEQVFQHNGPLKWQARLQEALLNQRLLKGDAALQLVNEILAPNAQPPVDQTTRWQALSVRAELMTAPGREPAEIRDGLAAFDELTSDSKLPAGWKQQTLFRKGVCLEALKHTAEALEAYYDILSDPPAVPALPTDPPPEDVWFHRAGYKARRLLENAGKYEEAVEIMKKLAKAPGPRGRAAADLVNKLLLQYKIWPDSR
ncbi:MAG: tetratricopeptide repeat protein [Verrucomicrobiaceae bacterium]|nr:MAG: tetratricopeptide repeat protein [Verrucomicrobiaceae bacterium]